MNPKETIDSHLREWQTTLRRLQPYSTWRAVCLGVTSSLIISTVVILGNLSPVDHRPEPGFHTTYLCICNLLLFLLLYIFNFWMARRQLQSKWIMALGLAGSLAIAALFGTLAYLTEKHLYQTAFYPLAIFIIVDGTMAVIVYLICLLLNNITVHQQTLIENEHLQSENLRIQHETLVQQISPHFLFNSLNTLDALIGTDDQRAHHYLQQLANSFRYTMQHNKVVTLRDEMEFAHAYIYMMQIRYGQALRIQENIDPTLLDSLVAPISIQMLIENAIKHNIVSSRHPLTITIATHTPAAPGQPHTVAVANHRQPKADHDTSSGIGLPNLSHRYRLLFDSDITVTETPETFTVQIPLQPNTIEN